MNFLLKIVEGPNKGAEIALVEGVAVTLGKLDECDIVLADPTLPDAPFTIEATAAGVKLDGSTIEPFHVKSVGSTAFAVGPSDAPWGELVREQEPVNEKPGAEDGEAAAGEERAHGAGSSEEEAATEDTKPDHEPAPRRRRGCLGCLLWLILLLLVLAGLGWYFREWLRPRFEQTMDRMGWSRLLKTGGTAECSGAADAQEAQERATPESNIAAIAGKYGLSLTNENGKAALSGNFRTRAERLAATAEAYAMQPGVELDLSDDESFRKSAEDALFTLTEGALKVSAATNRVLAIIGATPSPAALTKTLKALNADLPRLRNVDVTGVALRSEGVLAAAEEGDVSMPSVNGMPSGTPRRRKPRAAVREPRFPVCGILTTPYPCLVLKNGQRIFEGAAVGDSTILKITADSVTVTNASGRFTWTP